MRSRYLDGRWLALLTTACTLFSSAAVGADMRVPMIAAPKPCCEGWAGFYAGVYFGAGKGTANETFTETSRFLSVFPDFTDTATETTTGTTTGDITGSMVDLFVGYNWQPNPGVVWGVQVEGTVFSDVALKTIGNSAFTETSTSVENGNTEVRTFTGTSTVERNDRLRSMLALVGRAGWLVTPDALLYGLGGVAFGHFAYPDSDDFFGGRNSKWQVGWTVGAGVEGRLTRNWLLRAEYRYVRFNIDRSESDSFSEIFAENDSSFSESTVGERTTKFDFHLGKIGVAYRFCYCD